MIYVTSRLLFLHIPRTAGTSIEHALAAHYVAHPLDEELALVTGELGPLRKHARASDLYALLEAEEWQSLLKFAVIRNPFCLLESLYFQYGRPTWMDQPEARVLAYRKAFKTYVDRCRAMSFSEWMRDDHVRHIAQCGGFWRYYCQGEHGQDLGILPLRFDQLLEDWQVVQHHLGVGLLPHLNAAPRSQQITWSAGDRRYVTRLFREDFRVLQRAGTRRGWESAFQEWKPA